MASTLQRLNSNKSTVRLEQIASLRARGIGNHIGLPQLVVCGDQSAGKSSVLEGITGLPFPRQDGVCTKFATEIILQHTEGDLAIHASIIAGVSRQEQIASKLGSFMRRMQHFDELPSVISEAGALMGLRGFGSNTHGPAFSDDVLRIQYHGPCGMHLSIVDLPGLISVENEEQTADDIATVHDLVNTYIENSRTIILAVVQAGNDIANQRIIQQSRRVDHAGQRTVGIITKPDLINRGTERRIALLAKNLDTTKLKLGFFLLKNPTPAELSNGIDTRQRQEREIAFFTSSPWKEQGLNMDRVGVLALRAHLQELLDQHIERELPRVRDEVKALMIETEGELAVLGEARASAGHMRLFLSRLAMRFHTLAMSALNGTYHEADSTFFGESEENGKALRLRAVVHQLNTSFSNRMRSYGEKRKVEKKRTAEDAWVVDEDFACQSVSSHNGHDDQIIVTEVQMKEWVKSVYLCSRGKELPGNFNHVLLTELFHIQSSRWRIIAEEHVENLCDTIAAYVKVSLSYLISDGRVLSEVMELAEHALTQSRMSASQELQRILSDEKTQQPITYNHYYTDNVQNSRQETTRRLLRRAMEQARIHDWNGKLHFSNNSEDAEKLLTSLQKRIIVDMDDQACSEALTGLRAYYKVAEKTFVDNVCRQVIERHLLKSLPEVFNAERVALFSDEDLYRIAAESTDVVERRKELQDLHTKLSKSLADLRKQQ